MRTVVIALLIGLVPQPSAAQPRSSPRMTCAEAMDLVKRSGDVALATGAAPPERIVRERGFCDFSEIAELRFLPTRDNPQCPVGYRCREPGFEEWNW